ncbi:S-methyl-5'-thioinosine phosphorylase [Crenobacter cavernae]|uniref:Purine nucleoside phosphorylase n=1 Tax=Crenobacter cavernae TaxID=2290923 RepID=A0ABY0FHN1_9NEIS|nr:S-methyl-5'-thioinosine phosphorylase [Crenobacter cavernae]RXZ44817.1 S-methyl-5'-thioinosine phosphorylase [Crenobacter cavernae]
MLAIIGGSGLSRLPILEVTHRQVVRTPYGEPSCALSFGRIAGQNVVFLARHGYGHSLAPHEINYRANIWALQEMGVKGIVGIGSVGGIRHDLVPGTLVVPDNLIDYTWGRDHTFFEGPNRPVVHVDFTHPYDSALRERLIAAADKSGQAFVAGGVYACTQGPRLESTAEIRRLESDGADMVGMTGMPEAALAREVGLPYAMLCVVSNWSAGKMDSQQQVEFAEGLREAGLAKVQSLLATLCHD